MQVKIKQELEKLGNAMVDDIKLQLLQNKPFAKKAKGDLIKNLRARVPDGSKELFIIAPGSLYEVIVDKGRDPGVGVPPEDLRKWISFKRIQPNTARNVKRERDLLFVINRKIKNEGIKGIDFTSNTLKKFRPIISKGLGIEYQKELDRIIKELKKEFESIT